MKSATLGIVLSSGTSWPMRGVTLDLDFIKQRYWWGGQQRLTSAFTTYTLNGSTFGQYGLTSTATVDITLAGSAFGFVIPGTFVMSGFSTATPATESGPLDMNDGTANERIRMCVSAADALICRIAVANVSQAANSRVIAQNARVSCVLSFATNDVKQSINGQDVQVDTVAAMPVLTTLRVGKQVAANTQFVGACSRIAYFPFVLPRDKVQTLSAKLYAGALG